MHSDPIFLRGNIFVDRAEAISVERDGDEKDSYPISLDISDLHPNIPQRVLTLYLSEEAALSLLEQLIEQDIARNEKAAAVELTDQVMDSLPPDQEPAS